MEGGGGHSQNVFLGLNFVLLQLIVLSSVFSLVPKIYFIVVHNCWFLILFHILERTRCCADAWNSSILVIISSQSSIDAKCRSLLHSYLIIYGKLPLAKALFFCWRNIQNIFHPMNWPHFWFWYKVSVFFVSESFSL